jgi:hypothetical protein
MRVRVATKSVRSFPYALTASPANFTTSPICCIPARKVSMRATTCFTAEEVSAAGRIDLISVSRLTVIARRLLMSMPV